MCVCGIWTRDYIWTTWIPGDSIKPDRHLLENHTSSRLKHLCFYSSQSYPQPQHNTMQLLEERFDQITNPIIQKCGIKYLCFLFVLSRLRVFVQNTVKSVQLWNIITIKNSCFFICIYGQMSFIHMMQWYIFSIITRVFSVTWSLKFYKSEIILIYWCIHCLQDM